MRKPKESVDIEGRQGRVVEECGLNKSMLSSAMKSVMGNLYMLIKSLFT